MSEVVQETGKFYYNYLGIVRKEYPKWEGWKIIAEYKERGVDVTDIEDKTLDALVKNFYLLKSLKESE